MFNRYRLQASSHRFYVMAECSGTPKFPVGASLLAMAAGQPQHLWLNDRYREQAHSYKGIGQVRKAGGG